MAEERILYLLRNLNLNSEEFSGNFPSLNPDFLQDVAKSLSLLIKEADTKSTNRIGYIEFLKRLCVGEEDHINVNSLNYETFIEASHLAKGRDDLDVHKLMRAIEKDEADKVKESVLDEAIGFYNVKLGLHKRRMEKLAFINTQNQKSFSDLDYTPSKKLETLTENMQTLQAFKVEEAVPKEVEPQPCSSVEKRVSDVKFAYAVLHLQSKQKNTVIENLLTDLEGRRPLTEFEIEFLYYLFKTEVEFKRKLLDSFPFLMELSAIEVSKKQLDEGYCIETDVQFLFLKECAKLSTMYRDKIVSIFYELFALSGYNHNMRSPIVSIDDD